MSLTCCLNKPVTCAGSAGAAMVATARASGTWLAAASTAAPPRLCPIRIAGARNIVRKWFAAATRSATLEEKLVLANSPWLAPRPVKSKRSTAMPRAVKPSAMRLAARLSLPQVKQCANNANATGRPAGRSSSADSCSPRALGKSKRSDGMASSLFLLLCRFGDFGRRCRLSGCFRLRRYWRMGPAILPQDSTDHIGIIVGPDALVLRRLDGGPVGILAQDAEIFLLARADDHAGGEDIFRVVLILARRTIVEEAHKTVRVRDAGHHGAELHVTVGDVHQHDAAGRELGDVDRHRLARHQMDRDRVRRKRIEHDQVVFVRAIA